MKSVENYKGRIGTKTVLSEGKILEFTPVLTDVCGQPRMLPPVQWPVDNWVLGFLDEHVIASPYVYQGSMWVEIPGSMANANTRLSVIVRVLEAGDPPRPGATLAPESVREILAAIKGGDA